MFVNNSVLPIAGIPALFEPDEGYLKSLDFALPEMEREI